MRTIFCCLLLIVSGASVGAPDRGGCRFNHAAMAFQGQPLQQTECLLRSVGKWGKIGAAPAVIPASLADIVGTPVGPLQDTLKAYLSVNQLSAQQLGVALEGGLSATPVDPGPSVAARYFVIHDTSSPNLARAAAFPPDDAPALNQLSQYAGSQSVAHVFVSRTGKNQLGHDFAVPWRATKFETSVLGVQGKGLFLHVELLQPRRAEPTGPAGNDAIAPRPGFTPEQYTNLALLYVLASARGGTWLIPAFHATIDKGLPNGHDDPQNFELERFGDALAALRASLAKPQ